jgi:hypothetical protein
LTAEEARIGMLLLFGREPTEPEAQSLQRMTLAEFRSRAFTLHSFAEQVLLSHLSADPGQEVLHNTRRFYSYLDEAGAPEAERVRGIIDALPRPDDGSGHDYVGFHARRMAELFVFLVRWSQHKPIASLLDVGLSPFIQAYKQLLPSVQVTLADVWAHPPQKLQSLQIDSFARTDLNRTGVSRAHGGSVDAKFDAIIFTEVLEHLLIDPMEAITDFLSMLKPGGFLFLSTPNYFAHGAASRLVQRYNPQPRYSRKIGNADTHYHLREFSLRELLESARACGAQILFYALSDCWDRQQLGDERNARLPVGLRSNIVLVLGLPAQAAGHGSSPA